MRYTDLGLLGRGGMGEVRRVHDRALDRHVAMKTLSWRLLDDPRARARFEAEASVTAGLTHPGIVPVHDRGVRPDGCPWYTMKLVEGRTLAAAVADGLPLRRGIEAFARVCEAMAYAHDRGVIHRDIKPDNIMLGAFGEVLLMDWGLARPIDRAPAAAPSDPPRWPLADGGPHTAATAVPGGASTPAAPLALPRDLDRLTGAGAVVGTPAFMAPEQLDPALGPVGPPADVYALGGTLYQIVTGHRPRSSRRAALDALLDRAALHLDEGPEALRAIADRALAPDPAARYPHASALAEAVRGWLDGDARRTRARALLADAERLAPRSAELRADAERLNAEADAILGPLPSYAPVDEKVPGWALEDAAAEARREARIADVRCLQAIQAALRTAPDLPEARDHLTRHYRRRLLDAEAAGDADAAAEYAELLRIHDAAGNVEWLRGDGALTVVTDPPGARVRVFRYVMRRRRLEPEFERALPPTPLYDHPLAMGSYALELTAPGRMPVTYPVSIERNGRWDGIRPGDDAPYPIWLPPEGAIGDDTAYVPAGWFVSGDPSATDGLPRRRVWVDGFAMGKHPVTNAEYIEWLDWLVDTGREAEALRHAPKARGGEKGAGLLAYARDVAGHFEVTVAEGMRWFDDAPVAGIDWRSARAFCRWRAGRDGLPLRLPHSLEWEKAARGVDGRAYGWGEHFDATWAVTARSRPDSPGMLPVGAFPLDRSPYGVCGFAGNVRQMCLDAYRREGPPLVDGRLEVGAGEAEPAYCVVKGGGFIGVGDSAVAAARFGWPPTHTGMVVGFRMARELPVIDVPALRASTKPAGASRGATACSSAWSHPAGTTRMPRSHEDR